MSLFPCIKQDLKDGTPSQDDGNHYYFYFVSIFTTTKLSQSNSIFNNNNIVKEELYFYMIILLLYCYGNHIYIYSRLYRYNYGLEIMLCQELRCCCFIYIYVIHLFSRKLTGRVYIYILYHYARSQ